MKSKIITLSLISMFGLTVILTSCSTSVSDKTNDQSGKLATLTDDNTKPNKIYKINGVDIIIRRGPGINFEKVINKKATEIEKETQYALIDYSCLVREDEVKDGWSKIVVVDPDWLSESHQGWIESKYIIKTDEQATEIAKPRKNKIFNDVLQVQTKLSKIGIGELGRWRNYDFYWNSSSPYYSFGSESSENGMQNNLAYYLESKNGTFIEKIKLTLNINNSNEKSQALSLLDETAKNTFSSLNLKIPKGLSSSINSGNNFSFDNSEFIVSVVLDRSKIDTWNLTIEAK